MEVIIVGFILLAHLAIVIERYIKFQKLSKEDKDSYNDGVYKINNITKANQRYRIIGFIGLFVALFVIVPIALKLRPATNPCGFPYQIVTAFWNTVQVIVEIYILLYFISRIIFEYVYIRRGIKNNNHLTQRERELLNFFYTKSPIRYIGTAVLLELIPLVFELLTSTASSL